MNRKEYNLLIENWRNFLKENVENWFLSSKAMKPRELRSLIASNQKVYDNSMQKESLLPEDED